MTDYRTLSGAAFQRAVRDDPDKWAEAFVVDGLPKLNDLSTAEERQDLMSEWFGGAMEAARKGSIREVIEGDKT